MTSTVVRTHPRLHVGLVDLGHTTSRRYGGAGFSLSGPTIEVAVCDDSEFSLEAIDDHLDDRGRVDIVEAMRRTQVAFNLPSVSVQIRSLPPQHVGFGTKTAMVLAALKAYDLHCQAGIPDHSLQTLSNRGGASGVGSHTFFHGGFVVDGGHGSANTIPFAPSSSGAPSSVPPLLVHLTMPDEWTVGVLLPKGNRRFGVAESRFFEQHTPIPDCEVLQTIAHLYHGVAVAIATADIGLLRSSLLHLHECGFKRRELEGQPRQVRRLFSAMTRNSEWAVGMSSMGPLLYCVTNSSESELDELLFEISKNERIRLLGSFRPRNSGFSVVSDE